MSVSIAARWRATHPRKRNKVQSTCKTCGKTWMRVVEGSRIWLGNCQPCAATATCRSFVGVTRSEEHRLRTGLASKGRKKSERALELLRQRKGSLNNRWNPDRETVAKNNRARKEMYSLIHNTIRRARTKKDGHSVALLGYTAAELYEHLTRLFKEGMSWQRRGEWHIDHVKPVAWFIAHGITDPKIINALSNLQPLWKQENLSKRDRIAA